MFRWMSESSFLRGIYSMPPSEGIEMSYKYSKAALLTGTIMAGAMIASPAMAQVDDTDEPAVQAEPQDSAAPIVVTGSRIARRNVETAAPVAVVQDEEFELSGTVNVENVINTLPQVVPGTTSFSNNPGNGTATLNLRNLGSQRTLVLVNGRRWMFYDTTQVVDLNTIPNFLLDSVDVVTGGASAVYGSDAVAGVVNFRLKDVQGVEVGGQYSLTERGDGARYQVHGAVGTEFGDGRGNATVYAEYYNREPIFQGDRAFSNFAVGNENFGLPISRGGSSTPPQGRINSPGFTATTDADPDTNENGVCDPGEPCALLGQGLVVDDAFFEEAGSPRRRVGSDLYNYAPVNYLQLPQERYLIGGYADYEFGGGHTAYTEVSFVNNRVATELAATPVTGTFRLDLDTIAEFIDDETLAAFEELDEREAEASATRVANGLSPLAAPELGVVSAFVQRRTVETGPRNSLDERNAFRLLGGMTGPITDTISYDAYYLYSRTRNANVQQGNISRSAFQAGLDGSGTPINIFGPNTLTPEQVGAISILAQNGDTSTQQVVNGAISGTFGDFAFTSESEPVGFALGGEYRKVSSEFIPDTALSSGDVIGFNAGQATEGSYNVKEVFAELNVPVEFSGMRLELTGAGRYSDYSLEQIGGVWTYAVGAEFSPIRDVTLRGQYQRAIRAPNVNELFGGQALGFPSAVDPCAREAAADPGALRDLCIANGVETGALGTGGIQPNSQIPATFGGNPDLFEETSESYTFGVVLQPTFLPGLTVTADYYNIEIEDAITTISLQQLFDLCFDQVQDVDAVSCQPFFANGDIRESSAITTLNPPSLIGQNVALLTRSGIDLEVSYTTMIPFSLFSDTGEQDLNLSFLGSWTESSTFLPIEGADEVECAGFFGTNCGEPTPEYKWTSRASFIDGPVTTSVRWRHLSSTEERDPSAAAFAGGFGITDLNSYDLIDLTFSFEANESLTVTAGVNNLFDTLPDAPVFLANGNLDLERDNDLLLGDNQEQANTYPSTFDVLGRDFFVSVNLKF